MVHLFKFINNEWIWDGTLTTSFLMTFGIDFIDELCKAEGLEYFVW